MGAEVEVYERAPELREVGAGIALASNALRALDILGLSNDLQSISADALQGSIRDPKGNALTSIPDDLSKHIGPVAIMHRAELLAMLLGHVDPARLHLGRTCVGVEQDSGGVIARFDTGETVSGDGLIGADGLRSAVRTQLFGKQPIRYAGYTGWRGVVNLLDIVNFRSSETWGRGRRFGVIPMGGERVYWYATKNAPEGERDLVGRSKEMLAQLFRGWHQPIGALIEATREDSILRNDIYDMEPLPHFVKGRAALLGDAAHATTPNLGQGACQAIEDAVVIAACLKTSGSVEAGLAEYERRRMPRVAQIALRSRNVGVVAQLENPVQCWLRDSMMRRSGNGAALRGMKSLLGVEILTPTERALFGADRKRAANGQSRSCGAEGLCQ
jgi:2-polyprenyl-6-methoxyphenol hydroxylase-like FAD-dependent oxidoreductase